MMTNKEAIENLKVWVIKNGDYSVVEVNKKDIGLFTQFFETKEEAEEYATFLKKNDEARAKAEKEIKGKMSNEEAIKVIKNLVETMDDYAFYTIEDKEAFRLAIKALEREETCHNDTNGKNDFFCDKCHCWVERRETEVLTEVPDTDVYGSFNYCPNCGRKVEK